MTWTPYPPTFTSTTFTNCRITLHTGDPGASGGLHCAVEQRAPRVFFSSGDGGVITNTSSITWASMTATENITHFSLWNTYSAQYLGSGSVNANAVNAGDTFVIAAGAMRITGDGAFRLLDSEEAERLALRDLLKRQQALEGY